MTETVTAPAWLTPGADVVLYTVGRDRDAVPESPLEGNPP